MYIYYGTYLCRRKVEPRWVVFMVCYCVHYLRYIHLKIRNWTQIGSFGGSLFHSLFRVRTSQDSSLSPNLQLLWFVFQFVIYGISPQVLLYFCSLPSALKPNRAIIMLNEYVSFIHYILWTTSSLIYSNLLKLPPSIDNWSLKYVLAKVQMKLISIAAYRRILPVLDLARNVRYEQILVKTLLPRTVTDSWRVYLCSLVD